MNIDIVSIAKKERSTYDPLYKELTKMISRFAKVQDIELFNKDVTKAHTISPEASKQVYTKLLTPYISSGFSVALHPEGKLIDSYEFSKLLDGKIAVKFYIGGAYGFEDNFLKKSDVVISLGNITMSHKIAKAVLLEQIYRGFSILSNHPYHK
ncbi:MAG: 23S rRNA (pseudouridine(1915)-N(3))-methyltransferase RlmH [Sulfurimonas sp.]|uniref:23S rRNA (pseudouridine(1915)-N(3))-methyltransferase RlmH n=1 Tax=Sulfurimonas sp. TaxID=2022749 RepID=UPI002610EED5|nr:23S rRNA (pseudouridine(1915)-N(3))-methyltransferase RlmH [Sulfurimonas sp.]MCW8894485.1 23S rRNA (pseudouridine(1915)-N(3))-methyltransferase RlmH [Sulfurimonas sp.]MCW8954102.1 23S rRNA (pseudouridine(1915)-N(3))-methyltransferase RlmH [Sulfurimonas sp.]MCW9067834.1 23S rRNA (pseudouridine(1915)-N(3))-methyltransferase RlmH [Sulfurimonas sp.]